MASPLQPKLGSLHLTSEGKSADLTVDEVCASRFSPSPGLPYVQARAYEQGISAIKDILTRARILVNSFHVTTRIPPEVLCMICSHLDEEDLFSASQVCQHWRLVLTSYAPLWTRFSCYRAPRTIASLKRCGSLPIQLRIEPLFLNAALEHILLHGNEIVSLTVDYEPDRISQLQQLFAFSGPSVERLYVYCDPFENQVGEHTIRGVWQDFPSLPFLRELFVSRHFVPIDQLAAPNLAHLALEYIGNIRNVTVQTILDMLSGCPLLETLLLRYTETPPLGTIRGRSPVFLPCLRSFEVGVHEVQSGLITYLDLPSNVATGFRFIHLDHLRGDIPHVVLASMQHVIESIEIRCITLAAAIRYRGHILLLIRFEGPNGSLEMTAGGLYDYAQPSDVFFGPEGTLFSHSPYIGGVTKLHIIGCSFDRSGDFDHVRTSMPNVDTISYFHCGGPDAFGLLTSDHPSPPPFPCLERVMVLGQESGLEEMARSRRDLGVPLKTLVIGRGPRDPEYESLGDYTTLGELVEDLQIGCPVEILEWGASNEILNFWPTANVPGLVSRNGNFVVFGLTTLRSTCFPGYVVC